MARDTDPAADDATLAESDTLGWLLRYVELPSDEWVVYPPGGPQPANFTLRFEKVIPAVLVGIGPSDSSGVHVLPHPDGLSVSVRFGGIVDDSVHEFGPPSSDAEHEAIATWTQTWVEHVGDRTERARIRTACAPVPSAGDRASRAFFDHFGSADAVAAAVLERNTAALTRASDVAERTATDLVVHYSTDAEWEHYRRHHDAAP